MAEPVSAPKGTYDILPADQPVRRWVITRAEAVFHRYGYARIDTPAFEETRLFTRGVGESTDIVRKEMYTFEDLGGRSMTLRPEGTAPVARAYVEHGMHTLPQPVKLYYHSPMFRYESPQSGRYRQHYQLGVEAFGSDSPELDAEVIGLLAAVYAELGLSGLELRINSMGCRECRPGYSAMLRSFLAEHGDDLCPECRERAQLNPLRTYDCKSAGCKAGLQAAPRLPDHLCPACAEHHERVQAGLRVQGIEFIADHTLVRGMDYYTRTTFEYQSSCWVLNRAWAEAAAMTTSSTPSGGRPRLVWASAPVWSASYSPCRARVSSCLKPARLPCIWWHRRQRLATKCSSWLTCCAVAGWRSTWTTWIAA
jgi:histidyl-tRNA synthetase